MAAPIDAPLLSIVIPVYNEREWVAELVRRVLEQPFRMELILIDDGSTDGTRDILPTLAAEHEAVRVLMHDVNQGKGAALRTGFADAKGDVIVIAGKGHEQYQEIAGVKHPFDDRRVAAAALEAR